jgi:predicted nucleotidyltransferase
MRDPNSEKILQEIKDGLTEIYKSRLQGVYLFGSYARGDQDAESDLDVLIVLDDYSSYSREVKRTGELISELSLKYCISISRKFVRDLDWQIGDTPLLRTARAEAISVYLVG